MKLNFAATLRGLAVTGLNGSSSDDEVLYGTQADDVLVGAGGADTLIGGFGNDVLIGDKLVVFAGGSDSSQVLGYTKINGTLDGPGDIFIGGRGDDIGWLTSGADTIRFDLGDGADAYYSWETLTMPFAYGGNADILPQQVGASDTIILGGGLRVGDVKITTMASISGYPNARDSVIVTFAGSTDKLTFVQGSKLKLNFQDASATTATQFLIADPRGGDLLGTPGDDALVSGSNNDVMVGGAGSDAYYIGSNQRYDTVVESATDSDTDVVKFGRGVSAANVFVSKSGRDINLYFGYGGVTLRGAYTQQPTVERFEFEDGTVWTHAELLAKLPPLNTAPVVGAVLPAQTVGEGKNLSWIVPTSAFVDLDVGDKLTWSFVASATTNSAWLQFDAATRAFSGTPAVGTGNTSVTGTLTVVDTFGATASQQISIAIADLTIRGTAGDDVLAGTADDDVINGGLGADRMTGGKGNDVYYVDNALDKAIEKVNEGRDTVRAGVTHMLAANVEDLVLVGLDAIDGTGNVLDNRIEGNAADNKLMGGDGTDTLLGAAGDDWLRGGTGMDTLAGGTGDDLYEVDNAGDVVIEALNEGADTVEASVTYSLASNVENLILTGTLAIDATGNALANNLQGNDAANVLTSGAGNDTLNGRKGWDTLIGGAGNDTYLLEDEVDTVVELAGEGRDVVLSHFDLSLAANVEDGVLLGSAASLTGNELANVLTGNNAANTIDGGAGADVMLGGKGNDLYIVDNQADTVIENASEGTDTVQSSVNYTLADNIENLTLTGNAEAGMGNSLNNKITGNAASNKLFGDAGNDHINGGAGADIMMGGLGNDKYWVDSASDLVVEAAGEGTDTVYASVSYALADNVENLVLTGNANINAVGNAGNNRIEGNAGNNILFGGLGNDTYLFGRGSGVDIVANFDAGKVSGDVVQLGAGIASADIRLLRDGVDLVLNIVGTSDQLTVAGYFENGGKGANALEKIRFSDGISLNHAAVLSRTTVDANASGAQDLITPALRAGDATALFDAPVAAASKTSDSIVTPLSIAESISQARSRFEQGLQNLKLGVNEQATLSRSEFAERRSLPLLWNLQDALLNLRLAKNADGRFTADVSIDSRATRDLGLGINLLGATSSGSSRLDQATRPAEVQQFDLALYR